MTTESVVKIHYSVLLNYTVKLQCLVLYQTQISRCTAFQTTLPTASPRVKRLHMKTLGRSLITLLTHLFDEIDIFLLFAPCGRQQARHGQNSKTKVHFAKQMYKQSC